MQAHLWKFIENNQVSELDASLGETPLERREVVLSSRFAVPQTLCLALPCRNLTLLHLAAFYDSTECLLLLLDIDPSIGPDLKSADDFHPLHYAAIAGSIESAAILLDRGADPNYVPANTFMSPLFLAARRGSALIINMLFDKKAKFDANAKGSYSPLNESLRCKHMDCFDILLDRGLRPSGAGQRGYSPLMLAICGELYDAVPVLISKGADVNVMNKNGYCPLYLACKLKNYEVVKMLNMNSGLRCDVVGIGKSAPIHWAAMSCVPQIVKFVIECGADVEARNVNGESAIAEVLRYPIHSPLEPQKRDSDVSNQIATLRILAENGLSVNDRRQVDRDRSPLVQNYLTRAVSNFVDVRVLEYMFSVGLDYTMVLNDGKSTLGDYMWEQNFPPEVKTFLQQKLIEAGYVPRR